MKNNRSTSSFVSSLVGCADLARDTKGKDRYKDNKRAEHYFLLRICGIFDFFFFLTTLRNNANCTYNSPLNRDYM